MKIKIGSHSVILAVICALFSGIGCNHSTSPKTTLNALVVLQPKGGEKYKVGDTVQIQWQVNSPDVSSIKVYLYHDTIETQLLPHSYPPDTTTFAWIVANSQVSNHCYIQIREYFGNVPPDSSGIFTITN